MGRLELGVCQPRGPRQGRHRPRAVREAPPTNVLHGLGQVRHGRRRRFKNGFGTILPARANLGYDENGKWESLMDEMADAQYMDAKLEFIDYPKLAGAVNERLPEPFTFDAFLAAESEGTLEEYPVAVVARALDHLDFVNNGL